VQNQPRVACPVWQGLLTVLALAACRPAGSATRQAIGGDEIVASRAAAAFNRFGHELYDCETANEKGNVVISPMSIGTTMAMATTGACRATRRQLLSALHLDEIPDPQASVVTLVDLLTRRDGRDGIELSLGHAMWAANFAKFNEPFLSSLSRSYRAPLYRADLAGDPATSQAAADRWIAAQTRDRIRHLELSLDDQSALVLTDALYFKGEWQSRFDSAETREGEFKTGTGRSIVPMMHRSGIFQWSRFNGGHALKLPYLGGLAMIILLPDAIDGVSKIDPRVVAGGEAITQPWTEVRMDVRVPRWTVDSHFVLNDALQKMGVKSAFDPLTADFCAMGQAVFIKQVVSATHVEVDEQGAEASAATAVTFEYTSRDDPVTFWVDHPFAFVIRDLETGVNLVVGHVAALP
jgi:serpin B